MVTTVERTAPGKVILCGEHSVVYGRPAIAVPVSDMRACARVEPGPTGQGLRIRALDLRRDLTLTDTKAEDPLRRIVRLVLDRLRLPEPDAVLTLKSDLPIASGMGSGAAITAAAARALAASLGTELTAEEVSEMTYEVEKIHHGTPSGIDNTVIAWEQPVYFVKGAPPETFTIHTPFHLLIANSGIASSTREAVVEVRRRWHATPSYYDIVFDCIGAIARAARAAAEQGALRALGVLLTENHELLSKMGVSLPELDRLVEAARDAGALGAKLTGSGQGGNIIALVEDECASVRQALISAGAAHVWQTQVGSS
ncbi:MAG: mevalonate kinase [Anaerolineae bacterium]